MAKPKKNYSKSTLRTHLEVKTLEQHLNNSSVYDSTIMNARKWLRKNGIRGRDPRHTKSHLMFSRNILTITQVFWEIFCGLTRQKHSIKTTSYEQSNGGLSVWLGVIGTMNLSTRKSWRKMPGHKFVAEAQAHLIMHQDKRKTSSRASLNGCELA